MKRAGLLIAALLAGEAPAHEEDVFELDDFIDPRELGTELSADGDHVYGGSFRFFDVGAGHVWNYQNRTTFTHEKTPFFTLGYHKYWRDKQINHRLSVLNDDGTVPRFRWKSEYARYRLRGSAVRPDGTVLFRNKISMVVDDTGDQGAEIEMAGSTFVELPPVPGFDFRARGGVSASYRRADGDDVYRLMWKSSSGLWQSKGGDVLVNGAFWVGYEHSERGSRPIPIRGKLEIDYRLNSRSNLRVFYSPAYQTANGDFESEGNQEVGLILEHRFGWSHSRGF